MTRKTSSLRRRAFVSVAALTCAVVGLVGPRFVGGFDTDLSFVETVAVLAATPDSFSLSEALVLPSIPQLVLERGRVSIAKDATGSPPSASAVVAMLQSGRAGLTLDDAVISFNPMLRAEPSENSVAEPGLAPIMAALITSAFVNLQVRGATVHLSLGGGRVETLDGFDVSVARSRSGTLEATGTFRLRNRSIDFTAAIAPSRASSETEAGEAAKTGWPINLKLKSELASLEADGLLVASDAVQLYAKSSRFEIVDAKQVAAWMNTSLSGPVIPTRLKATGAFELSPRGLSFIDATFLIDANEAVGTLGLKLSGVRPAFDGTLAFEKLDLTAYQAKQPADSPPLAPGSETGADQAAIQLLQLFDADLRVSANSVKGANFSFGRSAASLNLKDGTVRADIAELEFGRGGRCGGQLTIAGAGASPVIALRGKVEAIDIGFLSSLLWDYPAVSGKGGLTLDVTARGVSLSEILRSLSGKTSVVVPSGGEIGIDVKTLAATVRAQPQTGWGAAGARSRTSVEGLTAEMSLDRGRLVLDRVSARAGDSVLTAHGSVGVASRQAELAIGIAHRAPSTAAPETTPPVLGTATAAGAIAPPGDAGQTVGAVLISGNLDAPDVRFVQVLQPPGSPASPEPSGAKP